MKYDVQHLTVSVLRRHLEHTHYDLLHVQEDELLFPKTITTLILPFSYLLTKSEKSILVFPFPSSFKRFFLFRNSVCLLFIFSSTTTIKL